MAKIETTDINLPEIYAYETPGIAYHEGWIKIGDTQGEFEKRIGQQTNTAGIIANGYCLGFAVYLDGSRKKFRDKEFHRFLLSKGINDQHPGWPGDEWFEMSLEQAKVLFEEFTHNPPIEHQLNQIILRDEQEDAVDKVVDYYNSTTNGAFLLNAKPRFGKTISAYEFCKRINAKNVLILTHMPAVANSWYQDYLEYLGTDSGYVFVSSTQDLKGKPHVVPTREQYLQKIISDGEAIRGCLEFVSLQDLKGSIYYGGKYDKLEELTTVEWDAVFVDEAHEGVDTFKTDFALDKIKRKFTLHMSGTPFKQIKNSKFSEDAIFNWTYVDEQAKKEHWSGKGENPYGELPKLNMRTYKIARLIDDVQHADLSDDEIEYAYKLNKFFEANKSNEFIHRAEVNKFLDALTSEGKFPLSSKKNREALAHSFWLLPSVAAAKAMEKALREHPIFKEYEIINVAGDMKGAKSNSDEYEQESAAYGIVRTAIANHGKTITLSVQRLTTGVTIPEWTAVFILSEIRSAQTYMQAAFRAQNPCIFQIGNRFVRKTNSYVFDFNPERSLGIIEQFANDLYANTAAGRGDYEDRKNNISELLKYLPVFGEDENGNLCELTADKVLSIPRQIRCDEVVRRGFMCSFLFTDDFSGVFKNPSVVTKILSQIATPKNLNKKVPIDISPADKDGMNLNDDGYVEVSDGKANEHASEAIDETKFVEGVKNTSDALDVFETVRTDDEVEARKIKDEMNKIINQVSDNLVDGFKSVDKVSKTAENKMRATVGSLFGQVFQKTTTEMNVEIAQNTKRLRVAFDGCPQDEIDRRIQKEEEYVRDKYKKLQDERLLSAAAAAKTECSRIVLTEQSQKEKDKKEDEIKEHLKGFARTIPSFLMAYGNERTTLETFEMDIPEDVFEDVTSITIEEFVFLRDGGDREDDDGNIVHFDGHVFEPTVFNDSVQAFLKKKKELAYYFDESKTEDIFDYIPPQKTNQIYTPKEVVAMMVDMLEENNPGCFDDPNKTFIDLYMKSGLYIAEIVKRLYRNENMKLLFPDDNERLHHIFKNQVYGLAPTAIIYNIAKNFVLGFDENTNIVEHNLKQFDATTYAANPGENNDSLSKALDELFGASEQQIEAIYDNSLEE
jgi:superfamily II DNA or RNA helicase